MNFKQQLNDYITTLNCSSKELAKSAGLSTTAISRYRNGERLPSKDSKHLKSLANGIADLSLQKGLTHLTTSTILSKLVQSLNSNSLDTELLQKKFNEILILLKINMAEMARSLNFDASYLSRIRTGQRQPADPNFFIDSVCNFIVHRYNNSASQKIVSDLINCKQEDLANSAIYLSKLTQWFHSNNFETQNYIGDFLKKMDEFNLDEYIRLIHFDELKVPTVPFKFPKSKNYYGIEGMKQGELDFFKTTVLSKSSEPLFMCSDMPMEDMAKDLKFGKNWMFAIAMCLKKGLHLDMIHNIDRPLNELMIGLESWIPIYMTGQISPYYLKGIQNSIYCHLTYVSGTAALTGECIKDFHSKGKYYLTNNKEEVEYFKEKANSLLNKSQPLMEIYRKNSADFYNAFITDNTKTKGTRRNILSSLPIYTISDDLLIKILKNNCINNNDINQILDFANQQKHIIKTILKDNVVVDEFVELSEQEFNKYPTQLSISGLFYDKKITYTYKEYLEHIELTKNFSVFEKNYIIQSNDKNAFRNLQIHILQDHWVMISKDTAPTIHFVIRHPKLRSAIENFIAPVSDV